MTMIFCFHNAPCKRAVTAPRISVMSRPFVTLVLSLFTVLAGIAGSVAAAEIPLSIPPSLIPATGLQTGSSIASDGDGFLAVWADNRGGAASIYGARLAADGTILDPTGIRIASGLYSRAAAVWTGRSYLVILSGNSPATVAVARVDRDGTLASPARKLFDGVIIGTQPAAWNGSRLLLAYNDGLQRRFALLDDQGQLVGSPATLPSDPAFSPWTSVASNGTDFLVVLDSQNGNITAVRVDGAGNQLEAQPLAIGGNSVYRPLLAASDGSDYLVLLSQTGNGDALLTRRVSKKGELGAAVITPVRRPQRAALAWNGSSYVAVFETTGPEGLDLRGMRFDASGTPIDSTPFVVAGPTGAPAQPALASNGRRVLASWDDQRIGQKSGTGDIFVRFLDPTPSGDDQLLTKAAAAQQHAAVAFDGLNYLAAWQEEETGGSQIVYINRIARFGGPLDGRGVRVTRSVHDQLSPRVLFDGTRFLVAWQEADGLFLRRVARDGTFLDPEPTAVTPADCVADDFDMATDGKRTALVWVDCASHHVFGARVDNETATVLDTKAAEVSTEEEAHAPRIVFGGGLYFVTWEERIAIPLTDPQAYAKNVRGANLLPNLFLLDDPAIDVAAGEQQESMPAVAWDNQEFLVTYVDNGIAGRYVSPEGFTLTDENITAGEFSRPAVVYDGTSFLVLFEGGGDIYAARVARRVTSTIIAGRFAVAATSDVETDAHPVLVSTGRVSFVYTRVATEPAYGGVPRVFLRTADPTGRARPTR